MGNPKTKKRKEEEAVVIMKIWKSLKWRRQKIWKPKMKRWGRTREAGSPQGSASIFPHVKKVWFTTAPDQIILDKRNMVIITPFLKGLAIFLFRIYMV
jgi:hypothetical protein